MKPQYIPPHLRGRVEDFRNEPGGGVSFYDHELTNGLPGDAGRTTIAKDMYDNTFSQATRSADPFGVVDKDYRFRRPTSLKESLLGGAGRGLRSMYDWGTSDPGKSIGTMGLLSGVAGGGLGYLLSKYLGTSTKKSILYGALASGLGGAALTAYGQRKSASTRMDATSGIISALHSDYSLGYAEKAELMRALARLGESDKRSLFNDMRGSIGAGAGIIVAKFLGARGLMPFLVSGIIGATIGRLSAPSARLNSLGQLSI